MHLNESSDHTSNRLSQKIFMHFLLMKHLKVLDLQYGSQFIQYKMGLERLKMRGKFERGLTPLFLCSKLKYVRSLELRLYVKYN